MSEGTVDGSDRENPRESASDHFIDDPQGRTVAEWVTLAISAIVVLSILGLVTYLYFQGEESPARIVASVSSDETRHTNGAYYVPVEVRNEGDRTVEDVMVEAELVTGGQIQTAELTFTYVAGGERVTGAFIFTEDPSRGELSVRPVSYKNP